MREEQALTASGHRQRKTSREDTSGECAVERMRGLQNASCCPCLQDETAQDGLCVLNLLGAG